MHTQKQSYDSAELLEECAILIYINSLFLDLGSAEIGWMLRETKVLANQVGEKVRRYQSMSFTAENNTQEGNPFLSNGTPNN